MAEGSNFCFCTGGVVCGFSFGEKIKVYEISTIWMEEVVEILVK